MPVQEVESFDDIADALFDRLVPAAPGKGVAFRIGNEQYFVFLDHDGDLQACWFVDRPTDIDLVETYTASDIREVALGVLEEELARYGHTAVVIRTQEYGPGAMPFLYVDVEAQRLTLLEVRSRRGKSAVETAGMVGDTGVHVVGRSFFLDLFFAPVTMAWRGAFVVGNTVVDVANPADWDRSAPESLPPLYEGEPMDVAAFDEWLDANTASVVAPGRVERILIGGDEYFPYLEQLIAEAQRSVHIRTYLFDNDDYAVQLSDLLRKRSRNIEVKVLVDGLGTIVAATDQSPDMPADVSKPPKIGLYLISGSKVKYRSQSNPFGMGDHAKSTIVDGERAFIGGMNIGREYRYEWHDLMVELQGPVVDHLRQSFDDRWSHAGPLGDWGFGFYRVFVPRVKIREDEHPDDYPIRLLETEPHDSAILRAQLEAMRRAKRYIWIENLYFSNALFLHELVDARQRGVDVRVIMPVAGNHGIPTKSAVVTANRMLAAGIRVYLYPRITHVKAAVYDGWACYGSANFDKLSFRVNTEINVAYSDEQAVNEMIERLFEPDFEIAVELTEPIPEVGWENYLSELIVDLAL